MRRLFIMDQKDYDNGWKRFKRPSVRGIIIRNNRVAMVYSSKFDYYKFPGGGIENNESHIETLKREMAEEKRVYMNRILFLNKKTIITSARPFQKTVSRLWTTMKLMRASALNMSLPNTLLKSTAHTATQVTMNT